MPAMLLHYPLDRLLDCKLAQARAALVQVLADLRAVGVIQLAVQVTVDSVQHFGAWGLMRESAALLGIFTGQVGVGGGFGESTFGGVILEQFPQLSATRSCCLIL